MQIRTCEYLVHVCELKEDVNISKQDKRHISVLPAGLSKKKQNKKNAPFPRKKHNFSKKRALFDIITDLKRVICLPFFRQNIPFPGHQVPIFSYFSQHTPIFQPFPPIFLFFRHFTFNLYFFSVDSLQLFFFSVAC